MSQDSQTLNNRIRAEEASALSKTYRDELAIALETATGLASTVTNVGTLKGLATDKADNFPVKLLGFYNSGDGGGGDFYWAANEAKANHNGGSIIDPTHTATPGASAWYASENTGTGCWKRKPEKSYVTVKEFGIGFSENYDEETGFLAVLAAHDSILVPEKTTVKLGGSANRFEFSGSKSLVGEGDTSVIEFEATASEQFMYPFSFDGKRKAETTVVTATKGSRTVELSDATGVEVGDLLAISENITGNPNDLAKVASISGNIVTTSDKLYYTHTNVTCRICPYNFVRLEHLRFVIKSEGNIQQSVRLLYCQDSYVNDVKIIRDAALGEYAGRTGLSMMVCYGGFLTNNTFHNFNKIGTGYGFNANNSRHLIISENQHTSCRSFDLVNSQDCIIITNNITGRTNADTPDGSVSNETRGISQHEGCINNVFYNNTVTNCKYGILDRGIDSKYIDNIFHDCRRITPSDNYWSQGNYYELEDFLLKPRINSNYDTFDFSKTTGRNFFVFTPGDYKRVEITKATLLLPERTVSDDFLRLFYNNGVTSGNFTLKAFDFSADVMCQEGECYNVMFDGRQSPELFVGSDYHNYEIKKVKNVFFSMMPKEYSFTHHFLNATWSQTDSIVATFKTPFVTDIYNTEKATVFRIEIELISHSTALANLSTNANEYINERFYLVLSSDVIRENNLISSTRINYPDTAKDIVFNIPTADKLSITIPSHNNGFSSKLTSVSYRIYSTRPILLDTCEIVAE